MNAYGNNTGRSDPQAHPGRWLERLATHHPSGRDNWLRLDVIHDPNTELLGDMS